MLRATTESTKGLSHTTRAYLTQNLARGPGSAQGVNGARRGWPREEEGEGRKREGKKKGKRKKEKNEKKGKKRKRKEEKERKEKKKRRKENGKRKGKEKGLEIRENC
jgi:hypothetical protein